MEIKKADLVKVAQEHRAVKEQPAQPPQTQTNAIKEKIQGKSIVPTVFRKEMASFYSGNKKNLLALVNGDETKLTRIMASVFCQVNKLPELINCSAQSMHKAIIQALSTGLYVDGRQACILPYGKDATFVPMYQGMKDLMYASGFVTLVSGHVVREHDDFDYDPANELLHHRFASGNRGKRIGVYCMIKNKHGERLPVFLSDEFVNGIKKRSRGAKSKFSPWNSEHESDIDAMWLKTAIKQAAKLVPTVEMTRAIEFDNDTESNTVKVNAEIVPENADDVIKLLEGE